MQSEFLTDYINGGNGADLIIGDNGFNHIPQNADLPRVFQIYRYFDTPVDSIYIDAETTIDYGVSFSADFELYPDQYREVDYLQSIVDVTYTLSDIQVDSNLARDLLGVSGIQTTEDYCMQPMFRIVPSMVSAYTNSLHGNDVIETGAGNNFVMGDDIRGATPSDLNDVSLFDSLREEMDSLIADLATRISTMEVDAGHFYGFPVDGNMTVSCDTITTDSGGSSLVTGDSMTFFARTFKGASLLGDYGSQTDLDEATQLENLARLEKVMERMYDIYRVILDIHYAFYEMHRDLMVQMLEEFYDPIEDEVVSQTDGQASLAHLDLANDVITTNGEYDIVVGDSMFVAVQVDKPLNSDRESFEEGFAFADYTSSSAVDSDLSEAQNLLIDEIESHIYWDLNATESLSNQDTGDIPLWDIPYTLTSTTDTFYMGDAVNLAAGDFAGITLTESSLTFSGITELEHYWDSVSNIRKTPSVSSFLGAAALADNGIDFYDERFDTATSRLVEPSVHGDFFYTEFSNSVMIGEFFNSVSYETVPEGASSMQIDDR